MLLRHPRSAQRADARTLVTLLPSPRHGVAAAARVLDRERDDGRPGTAKLAQVTKVDDVIVSEKVISLIAAQISENPDLAGVLGDILTPTAPRSICVRRRTISA